MSPKKTQDSTPQKKAGKARPKDVVAEDPPVVVGGGNSVDIIFKNTANPVTPPAGRKKFRLPTDITSVVVYDGINPGTQTIPVSGTFWVEFF